MIRLIVLFSAIAVFISCNSTSNTETQEQTENANSKPNVNIPVFNSDSAYEYVANQVAFGPRVPGSKAHDMCFKFFSDKLHAFADTVIFQTAPIRTFDGKSFPLKNIIASINPSATNRLLLCAHWDTRPWADGDTINKYEPFDGADDGASSAAVLLELARQLKLQKPTIGIDLVFFDLEDYGQEQNDSRFPQQANTWCLGSQHWAKNLHVPNYNPRFGILLDMVGGKNAIFPMEGTSMQYAPAQVKQVWDLANNLGYSSYFSYAQTNPTIDDHLYVNTLANIPCIDIVHYVVANGRYANHHHTHADNMQVIDKNTLQVVGNVLMHLIYGVNI